MKHFISSLSVINANTPPCEGRVSSRKFLTLLLILFLGVGNAWAEEVPFSWEGALTATAGKTDYVVETAPITLTFAAGTAQNAPRTNKEGSVRMYASTTLTISCASGNITKVVFTSTDNSYTAANLKCNGTTLSGNEWTLSPPANEVLLTASANARFKKIVVTYEPASSGGDEPVATLTANPTTIDFGTVYEGATVADKTVAVNFENLTGDVTYSGLSTPFTATGAISATGDKITISADASSIGEYSQTLTIASTADSKTAEVTVKMNVVEKPAPTGTFTLHTGELIEGDYVIYYSGKAMKAEVASNRLQYVEVTPSNNEIVDPAAAAIWHIAKSGANWTVYNNNKGYAAGTGTKSQAGLVTNLTGDNANKAAWTVTASGNAYEFVNVWNKSKSVNANLRNNTTYGFACYATGTGGALSLYRKAGAKYNVTVNSTTNGSVTASPTSAEAGATIALTVAPDAGYVLDALTVTDASSNTIEVADNKFTMPAADVTIAATFKENEKPAATLTLSKNGVEETFPGSWKQDDVVTLPSITSDCVKEFVGWDSKSDCTDAPEYKAGDEYTLAETAQTLYAVYATVNGGGEATASVNMATYATANSWGSTSSTNQKQITINSDVKAVISAGGNSGKYYSDGVRIYQTESAKITISTSLGELKSVKFTFTNSNSGTLLYGSTTLTSNKAVEVSGTSAVFSVGDTDASENKGQIRFTAIEVTYASAPTYSDYSTTCAAAPKAEVNPTTVSATAAGANGKVTVTYDNVKTENVAVALFNDAACTETFTADWLTASLDGDKNIAYTVAATTLYTERKAYIQLTAPETTGATEPAVVVIPVTQAGKDKVFASLEELVAAITPTMAGIEVTVTLTNEVIQDFYKSGSYTNGIALNVPYEGGVKVIEIYCKDVPAEWVKGGKVSGTITCPWKLYNSTWELCPTAWTELTYTAPATVSSIAVSGTPTKTTYIDGEKFDPAGLVVTATYSDASTGAIDAALVDWTFDPATLVKGQTSVNVTAKFNSVSSAAYEVTGLTVNDIPTKTVAEFIAAGGTRCYLEGIVSNIKNTIYGNFDLTDASGTIYVYGCLNASGEAQKFASLGVKAGDKIKVIADVYELYNGTTEEAKNVQYVSHISAATINIADITMEVGETKTIAATVVPAEAEVTYTIKENAANAISLSGNTITANAVGTATITATIAEGATYMGNSVDFTVTVGPKSEKTNVVILAQYNGDWYALVAAKGSANNTLGAVEVTYVNGVILDFVGDKASITWERAIVGNKATFKNGTNYMKGATGDTDLTLETSAFEWDVVDGKYLSDANKRTFLFQGSYFKNYAISNAGKTTNGTTYSAMPVVTAVEFMKSVATPSVEKGIFSVADGKFVQFSTGNLQYEVGTNTWSFAENQYDYVGEANINVGNPNYEGKIDMFGWSADGKFGVNPSNKNEDYYGTFQDWGTLVNEEDWYTLSADEWKYLLNTRANAANLKQIAKVDGVVGIMLFPDAWTMPADVNVAAAYDDYFKVNIYNYTLEQWAKLEAAGAVFLPAAGRRTGGWGNTTISPHMVGVIGLDSDGHYKHYDNGNIYCYYWTSTINESTKDVSYLHNIQALGGDEYTIGTGAVWGEKGRYGQSVRLVKAITPDYKREVRQGYYGTICLENGGQMIGASRFELSYYNEAQGLLYMDESDATMVAGNPYIFLPNEGADTLYVFYDETTAAAQTVNGLVGSYTKEELAVDATNPNYILKDNKIKKVVGTGVSVGANKAYIKLGDVDKNEPAPVPGRRRVAIGQAPQVATGMESVDASAQPVKMIIDGQLYILRGEKMYDAQGKLVK